MNISRNRVVAGVRPGVGFAALAGLLALAPHGAGATTNADLLTHRALYEMDLVATQSGGNVADVDGVMKYEWIDACEAWTTDQKFNLRYTYSEGGSADYTSHYAAWESKDGETYHVRVERTRDGEVTEEIRGMAARDPEGSLIAEYRQPETREEVMAGDVLLPTEHLIEVLDEARAGRRIFNARMFDGSDGEGPVEINIFYAGRVAPDPETVEIDADLLQGEAHRMRLAFFPDGQETEAPEYEMTLVMLDNGVVTSLRMDYPDFSIGGKLLAVEAIDRPEC